MRGLAPDAILDVAKQRGLATGQIRKRFIRPRRYFAPYDVVVVVSATVQFPIIGGGYNPT